MAEAAVERAAPRLLVSAAELERRSAGIRAVVFDWDGVFNDGTKDLEGGSPFNEVDSMGVNLLRFGLWLKNGERLPKAAVITGQHNAFAERYGQREHFHGVYMGFLHKPEAFGAFLQMHGLNAEQVAFFYDDVLDLPVADRCGLRVLFGHPATQRFQRSAVERGAVDLIVPTGGHALREACELLIGSWGLWNEVVDHRAGYTTTYQRYFAQRQAAATEVVRQPRP